MQQFIKCFVRDPSGTWRCIASADLDLPEGRIQIAPGTLLAKGTRFMNVDVAALLDEQNEKDLSRPA